MIISNSNQDSQMDTLCMRKTAVIIKLKEIEQVLIAYVNRLANPMNPYKFIVKCNGLC